MNKRKFGDGCGFSYSTQQGSDGGGGEDCENGGWMRRPENIWNDGPSNKTALTTRTRREGTTTTTTNTNPTKNDFSVTSSLEKSLDRELTSVDREYEDRLSSVETWKSDKVKGIMEKYGHKGTNIAGWDNNDHGEKNGKQELLSPNRDSGLGIEYFDYRTNQFDVKNGGTACSSISMVAVYNFLRPRKEKRDITTIKWDSVVKNGANLWHMWWKNLEGFKGISYQTVIEAYNMKNIKTLKETIAIMEEIGGHLDDAKVSRWGRPVFALDPNDNSMEEQRTSSEQKSFYSLLEAVQKIRQCGGDYAATLTIRNATVSMFYDRENFWVFDSHGSPNREHHSALIKCSDENSICYYLREKYPLLRDEGHSIFVEEIGGSDGSRDDKDPNIFFIVIFSKVQPNRANVVVGGDDDDDTTDEGDE